MNSLNNTQVLIGIIIGLVLGISLMVLPYGLLIAIYYSL